MEEFLNSEKFLQMAKEYNKKYSTVTTLGEKQIDEEKLHNIICKVDEICFMASRAFNNRFIGVHKKIKEVENILDDIRQREKEPVKIKFFNFKVLLKHILQVLREIFELLKEGYTTFYPLFDGILALCEEIFMVI